jgi:hypothetical protein
VRRYNRYTVWPSGHAVYAHWLHDQAGLVVLPAKLCMYFALCELTVAIRGVTSTLGIIGNERLIIPNNVYSAD